MSGTGKYTTYVPKRSVRRTFLEKLFKASPLSGLDDATAIKTFADLGNKHLLPSVQRGEQLHFPDGVSLDYKHENAPDFSEVKWTKRGDPASAWFPDLVSPGPGPDGQVNFSPNETDPNLVVDDVKSNYVPGVLGTSADGGTGTVSPTTTSDNIARGNTLGRDLTLGSSQK